MECKATFVSRYHCIIKDFVNSQPDAVLTKSSIGFMYWRVLDPFVKLRKSNISSIVSVCLSVCLSVCSLWNNSAATECFFYEIWYLNIFRKSAEEIPVLLKVFLEGICTFMFISRWVLLRMRNISDKNCTENQNTFYVQYFSSENLGLWTNNVEKYDGAGSHRWRYNTGHAHCMLYNLKLQTHTQNM